MPDNYRQPITTPDGFRVASRPETLLRRRSDHLRNVIKRMHTPYKRIVPPYLRGKVRGVFIIIAVAAIVAFQFLHAKEPPLAVYFYDIGQGDAIHVRTASGYDVLIDGGPTGRVAEKLGRTLPFWDHTIELMVLTHPHADHVAGLLEVLKRFEVERVLATGVLHTTDEYRAWLEEIKEQEIPLLVPQAGQEFLISNSQFLDNSEIPIPKLEILYPFERFEGKRVAEAKIGEGGGLNDTSIVARLTFGQTSFLFMGDATSVVEEQLLQRYDTNQRITDESTNMQIREFVDSHRIRGFVSPLAADVLKVGHHGSKYSTSREFLEAVRPKYAVIQVGKNRYGHPAFATLWRLKQAGVEVLRNDTDGDIIFETDGTALNYYLKGVRE